MKPFLAAFLAILLASQLALSPSPSFAANSQDGPAVIPGPASEPAAASADLAVPRGPLPGNFGQPAPWLCRGATPSGEQLRTLSRMGVRTIVDLRRGWGREREAAAARRLGLDYVSIPMTPLRPPSDEQVALLLALLDDPARRPLFVHCRAGKHRAGLMIGLYRVLREGWSAEEALDEMRNHGFGRGHRRLREDLFRRAAGPD
jgi:protein-tyrosine phosphatase